jgi:response regulator RpfG family c-di-GMP phosphodiesterase
MNRKRQAKPVLFISKRKKTKYLGNYQFNNKRITIYILKHSSIEELCNKIIHEYVHHLQLRSIKDDIRYNKLTKQKLYWENDYKVEARTIASNYTKQCLRSLENV